VRKCQTNRQNRQKFGIFGNFISQQGNTHEIRENQGLEADFSIFRYIISAENAQPDEIKTCNINQAIICFRVSDKIYNKYLAYYLLMPKTQDKLLEDVRKSTGQWNITKSICSKLQIYVPPFDVQYEIVKQLDQQMVAVTNVRFLKTEAEKQVGQILIGLWK